MDSVQLHLDEWRRILDEVDKEKFPRIAETIKTSISQLEAERCALEAASGPVPVKTNENTTLASNSTAALSFTSLSNFSWDQTADHVKVYVTLEGVGDVPKDCIKVDITQQNCEIQVHSLKGKNYKFFIRRFPHPVDALSSSCKTRKNILTITLKKAKYNWWESISYKEPVLPKNEKRKEETAADPQASVMRLMRDLYESGDDDMKRTIKKAWVEAADKRQESTFGESALK